MEVKKQQQLTKAQIKRNEHKEKQAAVAVAVKLVQAANQQLDPLASFIPFKHYDRNGLRVTIECKRGSNLCDDVLRWAFALTKSNMQTLYEQSEWRWRDRDKREEMEDVSAWYLIARVQGDASTPVAFVHFRFDLDNDVEVVYCYEIQLEKCVRRKGLGRMLMQILELLAFQSQMKKVVLTVFNHNCNAKKFFIENMKYEIDETSPSRCEENKVSTYEILSKKMATRKTTQ